MYYDHYYRFTVNAHDVKIMAQPVSGMIAVPLDCLPLMLFGLPAGPRLSVSLLGVATGSSGSSLTPSKIRQ